MYYGYTFIDKDPIIIIAVDSFSGSSGKLNFYCPKFLEKTQLSFMLEDEFGKKKIENVDCLPA